MRLIPGRTKVRIEIFKGVSLGDIIVVILGAALVLLFAISSLPWKLGICIAIAFVTFFLVLRLDDEPNYIFLLKILKYLVLPRRFERVYNDEMLLDKQTGKLRENVINRYRKSNSEQAEKTEQTEQPEQTEQTEEIDFGALERFADDITAEEADMVGEEMVADITAQVTAELASDLAEDESLAGAPEEADTEETTVGEETLAETNAEEPETADTAKSRKEKKKKEKAAKKEKQKPRKIKKNEIPDQLKTDSQLEKEKKKALKELIKEENRILKSKTATEEEKNAVWQARADRSALRKKEKEEAKASGGQSDFMDNVCAFTDIKDDFIEYGGKYYGTAIEIDPIEFRFFSQHRRNNSIENGIGKTLRSMQEGNYANIVKIERPIKYDDYMNREYDRLDHLRASYESGMLSEEELQARVEILYDRINELSKMCFEEKVVTAFYYLVLFEEDKGRLRLMTANALSNLQQGEMTARRLGTKELAIFLKYTNSLDFDERDIDKIDPEDYAQWAMPENLRIRVRDSVVSNVITHTYRVTGYPTLVGDAFLAGVMSIPGTKVVIKATPIDRNKSISSIDRSLQELRSQYQSTNIDSKLIELGQHINSLSSLLTTLQGDNETMMDVNIYVTAYDIAASRMDVTVDAPEKSSLPVVGEMNKVIRQLWSESNLRLTRMDFDQLNAFIASQVSNYDPMKKLSRGMPSNSVAATFPWIYSHISDESGFKLGSAEGVPVFVDFFRRDNERINSNMVIIGKSGSGKSYATKALLGNLAADDAKIFILDPENEYQELAQNLHGKIINVGNAQFGRLNPFHIITALDDDDDTDGSAVTGSFATHLQFLEEFFRQILPDCEKDALEYLNSLVERMYTNRGIYADTDLSAYGPEDYPVFDDLYDEVLAEFERTENEYLRSLLRTLINYIAKFSTGGRNANIWNGPSTVTTDENFTVFNFQSMLSNRNTTIANAQMLLVLKYIDNEIIKNRDYNTKYNLNRKIVVVIDEAHVFIDEKFPIALDFMFQLAKRIRKYNGMQIVITQNIKDFVGSEELARKSTAIINACQYSFIFALAPNDMHDLCKLYEKAGGINESEQEQIMQAPRGQAFTVLSSSSRSTFQVQVPPSMVDMFQQSEYTSHYFIGEQGEYNWESYVADSRTKHDISLAANKEAEEKVHENRPQKKKVTFNVMTQEELDARNAQQAGNAGKAKEETASEEMIRDIDAAAAAEAEFSDLPDLDLLDEDMSDEEFEALLTKRAAERAAGADQTSGEASGDAAGEVSGESAYDEFRKRLDEIGQDEDESEESPDLLEETDLTAEERVAFEESSEDAVRAAARRIEAPRSVYTKQIPTSRASEDDAQLEQLRAELSSERNRLESERLETQRKTLELERAALEAQKSAGMQDALLKLGEMLQLMQQQIMLQQSSLQTAAAMPQMAMAAAGTLPLGQMPIFGADAAAAASSDAEDRTTGAGYGMEEQKSDFDDTDDSDLDFGSFFDDEDEGERDGSDEDMGELLDRELDIPDLSEAFEDDDEDDDEDITDDEVSSFFDYDPDEEDEDEDDTDLPDEEEFEKFLFGEDEDDEDEDDEDGDDNDEDDDSALSFNIFDLFKQEAEYIEHYNPMDDFMDSEEDIIEITLEQLMDFNKNRHKKEKTG
ncbi:MAG: DUF87 domain-containing protein [Lachnospiraceae bacterium]|nr:DUF87 domain-containing protein [Lachnospiraceae bacterium]